LTGIKLDWQTGAWRKDLPRDDAGVERVDFHEEHVAVFVDDMVSDRAADRSEKLGHRDPVLLLVVGQIEAVVEHLQLHDRQLLFQLQRDSMLDLVC